MPQAITAMLLSVSKNPYVLLLIVNIMLLVVGCFLETLAAILLFSPLVTEVLTQVGLDPVHIGVVFILNLMIGLSTPPVGMSLYLVSNVASVPIEKIFKQMLPFYIPLLLALLAIT